VTTSARSRRSRARFARVGRLARGYHPRQVEQFLTRVELAKQGAMPPVSAREIRETGFELVRHGYQVEPVDAALDALELEAVVLAAAASRRGRADPAAEIAYLRRELSGPYMRRFPRQRFPRRGYHIDDVDEFVDRVIATLDAAAAGGPRGGPGAVTLVDVRTVAFRPKRGGYAEEAVDEALDRVVEMMLLLEADASSATGR
jgi:DivIVA domain-containing protein